MSTEQLATASDAPVVKTKNDLGGYVSRTFTRLHLSNKDSGSGAGQTLYFASAALAKSHLDRQRLSHLPEESRRISEVHGYVTNGEKKCYVHGTHRLTEVQVIGI